MTPANSTPSSPVDGASGGEHVVQADAAALCLEEPIAGPDDAQQHLLDDAGGAGRRAHRGGLLDAEDRDVVGRERERLRQLVPGHLDDVPDVADAKPVAMQPARLGHLDRDDAVHAVGGDRLRDQRVAAELLRHLPADQAPLPGRVRHQPRIGAHRVDVDDVAAGGHASLGMQSRGRGDNCRVAPPRRCEEHQPTLIRAA